MAGLQGYVILLFAAMALSAYSLPQQANISGLDIITSVHVIGNQEAKPVNKNETVEFGEAVRLRCRAAINNGSIDRVTWYWSIDRNNTSSPYLPLPAYPFAFKKLIIENTADESNVYISRFTTNFEGYYHCVVRSNGMYMSQLVRVSLKQKVPEPFKEEFNTSCSSPQVMDIKVIKHMTGIKYDNNTEGVEYNNITLGWRYDPSNSTKWCHLGNFAIRYSVWDNSYDVPARDPGKIAGYDEYNWSQWQSVQRGSTEFFFPFISTTLYYLFQVAIPPRNVNPHSQWHELDKTRLYDSNVIFYGRQKGAKITQILPSETVNVSVGTPVTLICEHEGYPRPNVYWTRQVGGFHDDTGNFSTSDVYRIDYAQLSDSGQYQCLVYNFIITDIGKTTQNDFKSATLSVYQESEKCVSFHSETCSAFQNGSVLSNGEHVLRRMDTIASKLNESLMNYAHGERNDTCFGYIREMFCHWAMPSCTHSSTSPLCQASCLQVVNRCADLWTRAVELVESFSIEWPKCNDLTNDDTCVTIVMEPIIGPTTTTVEPTRPTMEDDEQQIIGVIIGAGILLLLIATFAISVAIYCRCSIPKLSGELKPIDGCSDIGVNLVCNPNYQKVRELIGITDKDLEEWNHVIHADITIIGEIGQGNFGKVFKAEVKGISLDNEPVIVAAKKLFDCEAENSLKLFLHEAKIMSHLNHPNIVRLYGVCLSYAPYYLLFEYMTEGDLNAYLRQRASSELRRLMNEKTASSRTESALSNDPAELTNEQLLFVCIQVARGMSHLANCNLLHRDLATRNCLVGDNLMVKIGDFGMSQNLYHHDYYRVHGEVPLPVRWMPPESIIYGKFTSETDVWAFGVVMWEVFSFAMQPYFGHTNEEVCDLVRSGVTLKCPENCPPKVFNLMQMCWSAAPDNRPTMQDLCGQLEVLLKNQMDSPIPYRDSQSLSSNDSEVSNVFETPTPSPGPGCAIHSPSDDSDMEP